MPTESGAELLVEASWMAEEVDSRTGVAVVVGSMVVAGVSPVLEVVATISVVAGAGAGVELDVSAADKGQ